MMEHFDEYLDDYLSNQCGGHFIPAYFGPKPPDDRGPLRLFRAYFTNTGEFEILGETFFIPPLVDEIGRIHALIENFDTKGSRFTCPQ